MKTLGIIPARRGSERFRDKHHALLLGKPMCAYTIEEALAATGLDRLVLSTDDPKLMDLAARYGVECIDRPAELAIADAPLDDALRHACDVLERCDGFRPDVVLTMQGNVPVRKRGQIDEVIGRLECLPGATAVCTAQPARFRPEWAKVILDEASGACASYVTHDAGFRMQDYSPIYVMDGAIYGVRLQTLQASAGDRTTHAWLGTRLHLLVQDDPMYSLEVDYPDQAPLAEFYLQTAARLFGR